MEKHLQFPKSKEQADEELHSTLDVAFESQLFVSFLQILERSVLRHAIFFRGGSQVARMMVTGREEGRCVRTLHLQLSFILSQFIACEKLRPEIKYRPQNISSSRRIF
jgi:hypothetical protein